MLLRIRGSLGSHAFPSSVIPSCLLSSKSWDLGGIPFPLSALLLAIPGSSQRSSQAVGSMRSQPIPLARSVHCIYQLNTLGCDRARGNTTTEHAASYCLASALLSIWCINHKIYKIKTFFRRQLLFLNWLMRWGMTSTHVSNANSLFLTDLVTGVLSQCL